MNSKNIKKYMYQCNMCCPELRETFYENILHADDVQLEVHEPFTSILIFTGDDHVIDQYRLSIHL